jgi:hypothetical protein
MQRHRQDSLPVGTRILRIAQRWRAGGARWNERSECHRQDSNPRQRGSLPRVPSLERWQWYRSWESSPAQTVCETAFTTR